MSKMVKRKEVPEPYQPPPPPDDSCLPLPDGGFLEHPKYGTRVVVDTDIPSTLPPPPSPPPEGFPQVGTPSQPPLQRGD